MKPNGWAPFHCGGDFCNAKELEKGKEKISAGLGTGTFVIKVKLNNGSEFEGEIKFCAYGSGKDIYAVLCPVDRLGDRCG